MARRRGPYTHRVECAENGCREVAHFEYDRRDDYARLASSTLGWRCVRHSRAEQVLSVENRSRETVLTVRPMEGCRGKLGFNGSNGFMSGPGFKAFAGDFPEGTRIRITAQVELEQAQRVNVSEATRSGSVVAEGVTLPVGEKPALIPPPSWRRPTP